jgi:hypothetical protein
MKRKDFMIVLVIIVLIGAFLFHDQILARFQGMSPMEAMKFIVSFVIHVAVATIVSNIAYTLPEFVKPWMMMMRTNRRRVRRQPTQQKQPRQRSQRLTNEQILQLLTGLPAGRAKHTVPKTQPPDDTPLDF